MYIAANLTPESVELLKKKIPPMYEKVFYHHMTIAFNPSREAFDRYGDLMGKEIELFVMAVCNDSKAQAVLVDSDLVEEGFPHITLSCAEGVKPFYSQTLIKNKTNFGNIYIKLKAIVEVNE